MPTFISGATITFGAEGSLIDTPRIQKQRDQYYREVFKVEPSKSSDITKGRSMFAIDSIPDKTPTGNEKYTPKQEDLVRVPFRLITETVVAAYSWRATDFTKPGVLKKSLPLAVGIPAYTDHMQYADMFIGAVESAVYANASGDVPAGINGLYMIDAAMNEKLARGLLSTPPMIKSSSVTVEFEYEPSHDTFEDERAFENMVGQVHADGRMVARRVTKITGYHESSILWMGADPFAKMLGPDGKPMGVDKGSVFAESSKYAQDFYTAEKKIFALHSYGKRTLPLNYSFSKDEPKNKNNMDELLLIISQTLGLAAGTEITADHLKLVKVVKTDEYTKASEALTKVGPMTQQIESLKKGEGVEALTQAKQEIIDLKAAADKDKPFIEAGKNHLEAKRTEVKRLAELAKVDQSVIDLVTKADDKALDGLLAQYGKNVTAKFVCSCKKCGSQEYEFKSTLADGSPAPDPVDGDKVFNDNFMKQF